MPKDKPKMEGDVYFPSNEVVAQAKSAELLAPYVRTIIEMGGEDAKLVSLAPDGDNGRLRIEDFSMNTLCAAGTGAFLDQQASRLGLSISTPS